MYALLCGISHRNLDQHYSVGSELAFLTNNEPRFPKHSAISKFLAILSKHIDYIFENSLLYIRKCGVEMDVSSLYPEFPVNLTRTPNNVT
jgi:hypothetical protein